MDLTKKIYFAESQTTTVREIEKLANDLLRTTWTIDIYRYKSASVINLYDRGWRFEFNDRKLAAGLCSKREKTIYISKWLLNQNLNKALEFENTLRHELAHALDFEMRGTSDHSRIWKAVAREVLCTAERCYTKEQIGVSVTTKYTLKCVAEGCTYTKPSHKAMQTNAISHACCNDCYRNKRQYNRLVQVQNY